MLTKLVLVVLATLLGLTYGKDPVQQSLNGTWVGRETEYWYEFPTTVPGGVFTDLMNLNIIDDIFTLYNDANYSWVGTINWTYALNFTLDEDLSSYDHVNLVFEGVDTFADIEFNNITVGSTQNMFTRYYFDVKDLLVTDGNNTVRLWFQNAPEVGAKLNAEQLKKYRIPWECPPDAYHGQCHINMIRKMQASFAWDWGPSFPSIGIWKPVYLEAYDDAVIRHIVPRVETTDDDSQYNLIVDTYFANNSDASLSGNLLVRVNLSNGDTIEQNQTVSETVNEFGEIVVTSSIVIDSSRVELWWPNGYGNQTLYELQVVYQSDAGSTVEGFKKFGFRFVELVQTPQDTGALFYFKINSQPIFIKGSNEIPINILPELGQDRDAIHFLLTSAKEVNMNMLRVWGGGVYESDYFYQLADELGIMIWQDFMFACSLYPATDEFLANVQDEVDHNIKRLYSHPSIVVYSGNNENEGVLVDNWYGTANNFDVYKADYVALYVDTIKTIFDRISGGAGVFISSSPTNGQLTVDDGYIGESPSNQFWGDVHFYNYVADPWDSSSYPVPRFCSEYGYQSYPFEEAWLTATNDSTDVNISGKWFDWRQHHPSGNAEIAVLITENLNLPDSDSESYTSAFIYLSEVYASQGIKVESEHYRRYRSYATEDGRGFTMGALYWQLNDVWVAPTWSSIDFTGRWKMLHYFAKDFFAPVIVTAHLNSSDSTYLQVYTVSDLLSVLDDVTVVIRVYNYDSPTFEPLDEINLDGSLDAGASEVVTNIDIASTFDSLGTTSDASFFYFYAQNQDGDIVAPPNYYFPEKLKNSTLAVANVQITLVQQEKEDSNVYEITLTTDNVALFVWLDAHEILGVFSENGFVQVEAERTVYFYSRVETTTKELSETLTVTHLTDAKWTA